MAFILMLSLRIILFILNIIVFQYVDITKIILTIVTIFVSSYVLFMFYFLIREKIVMKKR